MTKRPSSRKKISKTARRKTANGPRSRKPTKSRIPSLNLPQRENLLSEIEYSNELAEHFDILYSDSVIAKVQAPFYKMLINKYNVQSALDLSCRTGQTLKMLSKLGIKKLAGVDASLPMIARAKKKLPRGTSLTVEELALAPFTQESKTFDLIICTKDSLPLVLDDGSLTAFFGEVHNLLNPNGVFLIETLNYEKIWRNKERFMPIMDRSRQKPSQLFYFLNDFHQELIVRNLVRVVKRDSEWILRALSIPARPTTRNEVEYFVQEAKFSKWGYLGSYSGAPFTPGESPYCITIALK